MATVMGKLWDGIAGLSDLDPLKNLDDLLAMIRNGRGHKITWSAGTGWRGVEVEGTLLRYGVPVYRRQYTKRKRGQTEDGRPIYRDYGVTVRRRQRRWAEYVLLRAGAPITSPLLPENLHVEPGDMPMAWGVLPKPADFSGRLFRLWMRL